MRPKLVFCGPTLPQAARPADRQLVYLPPAVQGSILEAVRDHDPEALLLIDGEFQSLPAVRHKEILWAVARGIPVLGAASMGALRAAELAPYMHGVGLIYRWYRRFALAPDDAVAVLHGPPEVNFAPLTEALIDLLMTHRRAFRQSAIDADVRNTLDAAARRLNFRDRTLDHVMAEAGLASHAGILRETLVRCWQNQKRSDALLAVDALRAGSCCPPQALADLPLTRTFAEELQGAGWPLPH